MSVKRNQNALQNLLDCEFRKRDGMEIQRSRGWCLVVYQPRSWVMVIVVFHLINSFEEVNQIYLIGSGFYLFQMLWERTCDGRLIVRSKFPWGLDYDCRTFSDTIHDKPGLNATWWSEVILSKMASQVENVGEYSYSLGPHWYWTLDCCVLDSILVW